ncbi:hypothetical protein GF108_19545 [Phyllobacterium sp. SYP-B3895]|uniref:hypothetical protein n=1 Tax=Phyllobacterium sp. SYP-B3895 TaxID=2663240 RepID=UPI001299F002|nr:hypothetical protein [Phyllobacterium sp. SYP-B3895]MRG57768.1 hypothetical protein [Phyllobacterium sp. SYP-B3895]
MVSIERNNDPDEAPSWCLVRYTDARRLINDMLNTFPPHSKLGLSIVDEAGNFGIAHDTQADAILVYAAAYLIGDHAHSLAYDWQEAVIGPLLSLAFQSWAHDVPDGRAFCDLEFKSGEVRRVYVNNHVNPSETRQLIIESARSLIMTHRNHLNRQSRTNL